MIYIGTSGFSYDDWKGAFYPEKIDKKDMLAYYARVFNSVEINSTYYAIPPARSFFSMESRTPADFKFTIKAHKDMTHADTPSETAFDAFLSSIGLIMDSGKLGCVLAQYPWSFKRNQANLDRIRDFADKMQGLPVVIEFRNAEWVGDEVFNFLKDLNLGYCCVDEPDLKGLMPRTAVASSDIGYIRFHGRNAGQWWKHEESYQRYDYLYSEEELREWVPRSEEIMESTVDQYIMFNNHYHGKSTVNGRMFAKMLGMDLPAIADSVPKQMTLGDF